MQTFLPYADYKMCAQCLDRQRLGKQRTEVLQILRMLDDVRYKNQPIIRLWRDYEQSLVLYGGFMCWEWLNRGYEDNTVSKIWKFRNSDQIEVPWWIGGPIHANHRANLIRKNPEHYGQFGWKEKPESTYFWPC